MIKHATKFVISREDLIKNNAEIKLEYCGDDNDLVLSIRYFSDDTPEKQPLYLVPEFYQFPQVHIKFMDLVRKIDSLICWGNG